MMWDPNADEMLGDSGIKKVPHPGHIVIFNSSKTGLLESVFPTALKIGTTKLLTIRGYNLYSKAKSGRCTFTPHDRSFGVDVPESTAATAIDASSPHFGERHEPSVVRLFGHNFAPAYAYKD